VQLGQGQVISAEASALTMPNAAPNMGRVVAELQSWKNLCDRDFIAAWDALSDGAVEANPFYESWFLLPSLQQFDAAGNTKLACVWADSDRRDLIGLMPILMGRSYGRWPVPHISNWLHHNAFLGTPLVKADAEKAFWRALLPTLDSSAAYRLFFHANGLRADGALSHALRDVAATQCRKFGQVHSMERALLLPGQSPDAYYEQHVRAKKRKELRRQKNRLAEIGVLSFERQSDMQGLPEWVDAFLHLEQAGWKGLASSAMNSDIATKTLFADALVGAAEKGKLERLTLRLDGRAIAMLANFHTKGGSFSFKTTFDESLSKYSPGVLLQIENLELLHRDGFSYCDSCAAQDHPMIDSIWGDRVAIGRYSVAIGGPVRRFAFGKLLQAELSRSK
jgi:CelD/BcsL family acetyltransferase involved in cellulose biosynthesis